MGHLDTSSLAKPDILAMKAGVKGFLEHDELFFIEATVQVKHRFPISDLILSSLTFLDPSAVSPNAQQFWMLLQNFQTSLLQMTYRNLTVSGANIHSLIFPLRFI